MLGYIEDNSPNLVTRVPCALVLDGTRATINKQFTINDGLQVLQSNFKDNEGIQLLVTSFGDNKVNILTDWTDTSEFSAPHFEAKGSGPLGEAMVSALDKIEEQKEKLRSHDISYKRPWIFLISGSEPTDPNWQIAVEKCQQAQAESKVTIFSVIIGNVIETEQFPEFSERGVISVGDLNGLFVWLGRALTVAAKSEGSGIQLPPIDC